MRNKSLQRVLSLILCALLCAGLFPAFAFAEAEVLEVPTAEQIVFEEPVVEEPIVEDLIAEEPVVEEPVVEEPIAEEPIVEGPIVEGPVVEEPVVEEPIVEEPVVEEPVVEEPVAEALVVEEPVAEEAIADAEAAEAALTEEEESEELVSEAPDPISLSVDVDMPDNLLDGYADKELGSLLPRRPVLRAPKNVGGNLSGYSSILYQEHKSVIGQIAAGQRESTVISIPAETLLDGKVIWTAEELGVDPLVVDGAINSTPIFNSLYTKIGIRSVLTALLLDCPYEMYWYDKTIGIKYQFDTGLITVNNQTAVKVKGNFVIRYTVASEYQNGGVYTMNTALGQQVQSAVSTAKGIVSTASSYSLLDKLNHYRQRICDLVSYNSAAASGGVAYGNPWQLIWVFDDNSDTNVVCEGYAKAFQYLCDLSNIGIATCYTVTGQMAHGTGAGNHMWNIVTMPDGKNYLVDITNCDSGSVGYPDLLFLKGYTSSSDYSNYSYGPITYTYDSTTLSTFSESDLTLSATDYGEAVEVVTSGQCGDNAYWDLTDGVLTISGTGAMANYGGPGTTPWYASNADIQRIVIEPGITGIGDSAFALVSNMTSITIPDTVTSIGATAFYGCNSLSSVAIPESVTNIGGGAFSQCASLADVTLPSGITTIGMNTFYGCPKLTSLTVPAGVTSVEDRGFAGMFGLTSITFLGHAPSFGGNAVFDGVTADAYYPGGDASWTVASYTPDLGGNITWMRGEPTHQCGDNLTWSLEDDTLIISGTGDMWNFIVETPGWYDWRDSIRNVVIGDSVTDIGNYVFSGLTNLDSVSIPASVTKVGDSILYDSGVTDISVAADNQNLSSQDGVLFNKEGTTLLVYPFARSGSYTIPTGVNEIYFAAFSQSALTSVTVPESVTVLGNASFANCANLTEVHFLGHAPSFGGIVFLDDTATAYYPANDASWTDEVKQNYSGSITWVEQLTAGWQKIDGVWYYYNEDGSLATGWKQINGNWYYFESSGAMKTGWLQSGSTWYYLRSGGSMATGWEQVNGKWYYFEANGAMKTGWLQSGNIWCYLRSGGSMATGWEQVNGAWYYFESNGHMKTGWLQSGSTWYYLRSGGAMATGWEQVNGKWYYFESNGHMKTGWAQLSGKWYYFQSGGAMTTGWLKLGSTWYYFETSGAMVTGSRTINGKTYNFSSSGACLNP